jgi:uncharacterized protein YecE (DUF72 family)
MGAAQNKQRSMSSNRLWLGTAGWNVPSACRDQIGGEGSHLKRYASRLNAAEINSSFYRPHRRTTYERWASDTPDDFRFSVKVPRSITHMLDFTPAVVDRFIEECAGLGPKLAVLLVQLPPKHVFDSNAAQKLFDVLRTRTTAPLVCEPRHPSWFEEDVDRWLASQRIARVAADPARIEDADCPGGWEGLRYFRLHGKPRIYYSSYSAESLAAINERLSVTTTSDNWCIFDNTALGAALENALWIKAKRNI